MMPRFAAIRLLPFAVAAGAAVLAACDGPPAAEGEVPAAAAAATAVVRDTVVDAVLEAPGTAEPILQATLSTKLMGSVQEVLVREGDHVAAGAVLLRLDARDLEARRGQVLAQLAEAQAVRADAETQAARLRRLYADTVATRAQLDAAETGLARAAAAVRQVEAGAAELEATMSYAVIRAPFAGVVTRRSVDPGAFAAPGAPLLTVEDAGRLRVSAMAAPAAVRGLSRGRRLEAVIEGTPATAVIEGVVPAAGSATYTVNAVVPNAGGALLAHGAATLRLPQGSHTLRVVPAAAVQRDGDLTMVRVVRAGGAEVRWIRAGRTLDGLVEVLSGLDAGERVALAPAAGR